MNGFAIAHSRALRGLVAPAVRVETHLANGLPSFMIVGLPEAAVRESRERVRAAIQRSGFEFPNRRMTVNLAPADLPKDSGRFDLSIAVGILAAAGQLPADALATVELLGELSLDGQLQPIQNALALCIGARHDRSERSLIIPESNLHEARLAGLPGLHGAARLIDVVNHLRGESRLVRVEPRSLADACPAAQPHSPGQGSHVDLADVIGQASARRALEICAAGRHPLLLSGPPGTGKSLLAERLPGLLPDMPDDEALAIAAVRSSSGLAPATDLLRPPFQAPHHSTSMAGLIGGGQPPRPGQISLALNGVLFLDELPEFRRDVLEALREPMETGRVTLARGRFSETYPADFLLVAAMNPCPCGYLGDPQRACRCTADQIQRYRSRLSGPLLDRLDLAVDLTREALPRPHHPGAAAEDSRSVASRVRAATDRQRRRQGRPNARLPMAELSRQVPCSAAAQALEAEAAHRLHWSLRARHRMLRVAITIADLAEDPQVEVHHVAEAIALRRPLDRFALRQPESPELA